MNTVKMGTQWSTLFYNKHFLGKYFYISFVKLEMCSPFNDLLVKLYYYINNIIHNTQICRKMLQE